MSYADFDREGEDNIISRIESGESQAEIARSLNSGSGELTRWLQLNEQRSARARDARSKSAECWLERAAQVLQDIPDDGTQAQISRAKELSQLYRRFAAIRNPREYGDKLDVSGTISHEHSVSSLFQAIMPQPSLLGCVPVQDAILLDDCHNSCHSDNGGNGDSSDNR